MGDFLIAFSASLGGAFFGAFAAYMLERHKRAEEEKTRNVSAILRAQLCFLSYLEMMESLRVKVLDEFRNDPERDAKLPMTFCSPLNLRVDLDSLAFLANQKKPQVFHEVNKAQRNYFSLIDSIETRNKFIQKLQERANMAQISLSPFELTEGEVQLRHDYTDSVYQATDKSLTECENVFNLLATTLKELFPGEFSLKSKSHLAPKDSQS